MSIVTKTGDQGVTALMYHRRVPKTHPRVEAYGAVDELNAALGLARASVGPEAVRARLVAVQQDLVAVMGELATLPEDLSRYAQDGYSQVTPARTAVLEDWVKELEATDVKVRGWATPGSSLCSAALDMARAICRRAERRVCALQDARQLPNAELLVYLNRLSDLLWLLARQAETWEQRETQPLPE